MLVRPFIKYVRDKYAGQPDEPYMLAAEFALKQAVRSRVAGRARFAGWGEGW